MCYTTSCYSYNAHYLDCIQLNSSPHFFKTNFHHFSPIFHCNNTNPHFLWMKKKTNKQQAFLITWPAPYRLELTHGGTSCCFALCEIRHLHTKATCSASIESVEIFCVCICWRLCATAAALYVVCPRTCNQSKHRVYRTSTWFVYWQWDPVGSVLSRLFTWAPYVKHTFQSRSLLFLKKEDSCRALWNVCSGTFLSTAVTQGRWQKEARSICSLGGELQPPHAAESNPRIFGKQGRKNLNKNRSVTLGRRTQRVALAKCRVTGCHSDTKNWCHQTMIQTTRAECDTTRCRVSRHQFRLLEDRKRLNTFPPKRWAFGVLHKADVGWRVSVCYTED